MSDNVSEVSSASTITIRRKLLKQQTFDEDFGVNKSHGKLSRIKTCCHDSGKHLCTSGVVLQRLRRMFPIISVITDYKWRSYLLPDFVAGLTVGIMNIPQGLAYGMLANLPAVYGLYVSFFPALIYFVFGSSAHISIGVFAVVSLMVGAVVGQADCTSSANETLSTPGVMSTLPGVMSTLPGVYDFSTLFTSQSSDVVVSDDVTACKLGVATATTLLAGLYQVLLGVLGLGCVTQYMPAPVMRGFVTGSAVHVAVSQLQNAFGIKVTGYTGNFKVVLIIVDFLRKLPQTTPAAIIIFIVCFSALLAYKKLLNDRIRRKIRVPLPADLIVLIIVTAISYAAQLHARFGLDVVGVIPLGIPPPSAPPASRLSEVAIDAIPIAIVSFAVSVSLASVYAKQDGGQVDTNQELIAYGLCNGISAFFSCFASCASLARSSVQHAVGGKTQISDLVSCVFILIVLFGIGPLFEQLPKSVLAAVILVNLEGLFLQFRDLGVLWKTSLVECVMWLVTFVFTVFIDVPFGLLSGVAFALIIVILRSQRPNIAVLGRVADTEVYKDIHRCPRAVEMKAIKIIRFDGALNYLSVDSFTAAIGRLVRPDGMIDRRAEPIEMNDVIGVSCKTISDQTPHIIIVDCSMMAYVDTMGLSALVETIAEYKNKGVNILLTSCKGQCYESLMAYEPFQVYVADHVYLSVHDAVIATQLLQANNQIATAPSNTRLTSASDMSVDSAVCVTSG